MTETKAFTRPVWSKHLGNWTRRIPELNAEAAVFADDAGDWNWMVYTDVEMLPIESGTGFASATDAMVAADRWAKEP